VKLAGRTALITGGARGIGLAIARQFLREGAAVTIGDRDPNALASALEGTPQLAGAELDVTDSDQWERVVAGIPQLDILINNAGVLVYEQVADLSSRSLDHLFDVNVKGVALGLRTAMRAMRPGGTSGHGGVILNLSSTAAYMTAPGYMAYCASKSAVERMTKVAANEAGRAGWNIRVNCLYPGNIETDMTDKILADLIASGALDAAADGRAILASGCALGRNGSVEDVARAALFLCSDDAAFITGAGLAVDGGTGLL
jgi:3alpha(or 20beta)-hydroxysteroid dehydrogenase